MEPYILSGLALLIHLYFTAFVVPYVGALVLWGSLISVLPRYLVNDIVSLVGFLLICPGFAPFLGWSIFVPLGCLSFLFFRATATRHAKGKGFWVVAWVLVGAGTGAAYAFMSSGHGFTVIRLACSGAAAGLVLAPWHRRIWIGLYPEADPRFQIPESSEMVRA